MPDTDQESKNVFQIFRAANALSLEEANCMTTEPMAEKLFPILGKVQEAGVMDGQQVTVLVNIPGFSLVHVWFKKDFPLPLHSHNADCLYYIIAGSIQLGRETLGPRDCFFVPKDAPYTYKIGAEGIELLEIRHENHINFINHANGEAFWEKALEAVKANRETWKTQKMPALNT